MSKTRVHTAEKRALESPSETMARHEQNRINTVNKGALESNYGLETEYTLPKRDC